MGKQDKGESYFDLTQSQLLMWTGQKLSPESPMYNMALSFHLYSHIDENYFQRAFQKMLQLSDSMKTVFLEVEGKPKQKILSYFPYEMEYLDFSDKENKNQYLKDFLNHRSQYLFDITKCLFDAVLIKMADKTFVWYFNQHHLITDAWATTRQFQTLAKCYQKISEGQGLDEITVPPFENYIKYEAAQRQDSKNARAIKFWEEKSQRLPEPPSFFGQSNTTLESRSERVSLTLDKKKSDALRALTKETDLRTWTEHLSLFSIFSTLLLTYLHRLTGQQKLAIGTPAHNRSTTAFKETPGLFIELFPIMAEIEPTDNFSTLFQKVRNESHEFLRYAQVGVSNSNLNRGFNVVLNYINASFSSFNDIPTASEWIHSSHADPGHLLRLQVHDFNDTGCIELCFDMNVSVFNETQRKTALHHFSKLLDSFIEDRFQLIGKPALSSVMSPLVNNENNFQFNQESTVLDLVESKVATVAANTVAIEFAGKTLSYQELDDHANQLANYLIQNGLQPKDRVAILLTRSPEFIISVLAILKAGGIFIPIPTNYPSGRILGIIEDAKPRLVLTNSVLEKRLAKSLDNLIRLDKEAAFIQQQSNNKPNIQSKAEDLAYILYTSGSTGVPKGVMIGNQALTHYIQWASQKYTNDFVPIVPLFTSVGFDLTITSIFLPLVTGGKMMTYQEAEEGPDYAILDVMKDNAVNFIKLTPSHLVLLKGKEYSQSCIKTMIVGGENFRTDLASFVQDNFGQGIRIFNEYGPTEATVGCVVHEYQKEDNEQTSVPIGQPISNVEVHILDEFGNVVPEGVVGELYIGGIGLAKGYWKQDELTEQQFIANPFQENSIFYRSGDLVRQHGNGYLEYLGRKDLQVKIRGRRVELAEIESVLNQYEGIVEGVVELRRRENKNKEAEHNCTECGLPSNYPDATFNEEGVCHLCQNFTSYQEKVKKYFKTKTDLKALFDSVPQEEKGKYDCLLLLSGGKDSSYTLAQLKEMGLNVLAFTLDNGYISDEAKANITKVVEELNVDHVFGETEAMNAIFVDSLQRHCNVCDGCFKTIYTLSVQIALEKRIPFIVTGLSRGQFFETRLTEELFRQEEVDVDKIDETILKARKAYHQVDDAVKELLDVSMFEKDETFEKVRFVDFYRYTDVSLDEMLDYLDTKLSWVRPSDTGRSTNCLINQAGIYVHKKEQGYSNYAFPYSWDVRIGHKTRDASLDEINEEIDEQEVIRILDEIGYTEAQKENEQSEQLVAYYVADSTIDEKDLRNYLLAHFPNYMVPVQFIPMDVLPLTTNGKVDREALPEPDAFRPVLETAFVEAQNEFEEIIQAVWSEVMKIDKIGIHDNFIEIGGDSLSGIRVMSRLSETFDLDLPVNLIFQNPTIARLAIHIEETIKGILEEMEDS